MSILIALFMSIAVNLDNFVIGIQLGMQNKPIPVRSNLIISAFTGIFAGAAAFCPEIFPQVMVLAANVTGALIILVFGIYCLMKRPDAPAAEGEKELPGLSFKGSCILGFTLAVNCIPPALGAGILGISPVCMAALTAGCSFICMHVSSRAGVQLRHRAFIRQLDKISALLLIGIGALGLLL